MIGNYYFITQQGIIVPDVAAIQEVVVEEYKAAFGQDLVTTPDTPQGDHWDVLTTLIKAYEARHFPIDAPDPVEPIK